MNTEQLSSHSNLQSNIVPFDSRRVVKSPQKQVQPSEFHSFWNRLWNGLNRLLTMNSEPKIDRKQDRQGNTYFRVYDPITGMTATFGSEPEVRLWLDQRYYL
ncbi:MAG: hypothetical protein IGS50_16235 [Synechococcales cyanobacterium C42_A2020_086]|jgi:hypothetical protein|nr:hypothetical protein [Synechococcales cyanobacterium C42_A2020_086]